LLGEPLPVMPMKFKTLNFVNKFSEINVELIEELQADSKGDYERFYTSNDVKDNQQKINHHG
jgi:hypothetical protein